ncbi:hypothetical protein FGRMN_11025 [Fusarium graminum]|nr:hypothetical protein FGRMN_11025 [Fusarium graminum]
MSDNHLDQTLASPSNEIAPTRPRQESILALLPTEILLNITGEPGKDDETLSARDFKALALCCSRLFHLLRPMYYLADNSSVYQSAIKHADVDTMERCRQFNALPEHSWELPEICQCPSELPHKYHSPFDSLLECVAIGSVPVEHCTEALKWLLQYEEHFDEQEDQHWWMSDEDNDSNVHCDHMPELIITLLGNSTDRTRTDGICQMIRLLRDHGLSLPFNMNMYTYFWRTSVKWPAGLIRKPMDVALRSQCPAYFLELVLQQYEAYHVDVKVYHEDEPDEMKQWAGHTFMKEYAFNFVEARWWQTTDLCALMWDYLLDMMHKSDGWTEEYNGQIAETFEAKLNLLIEYQAIDTEEEKALRSILAVLKEYSTATRKEGKLDIHDGKECWLKLVAALRPWGYDRDFLAYEEISDFPPGNSKPERVHRFRIDLGWEPYTQWYVYELQDPKLRAKVNHPWLAKTPLTQSDSGVWDDSEWTHGRSRLRRDDWRFADYDKCFEYAGMKWEMENNPSKAGKKVDWTQYFAGK